MLLPCQIQFKHTSKFANQDLGVSSHAVLVLDAVGGILVVPIPIFRRAVAVFPLAGCSALVTDATRTLTAVNLFKYYYYYYSNI